MDCVQFVAWFGTGVFIVPLLGFLKRLPTVGPVIEAWAWLAAPLLAALAPVVAQALKPYCGVIDPALWQLIYLALAYLVSQLVFWLNKRLGVSQKFGL